MSIKGFIVNGSTQKYDYNELDNKPTINGIPSGGSAGQVLAKNSSTNYDVTWVNQSGGGGGGGTSDYSDLINKPSINSVTLSGNKTTSELGLVSTTDLHNVPSGGSVGQVLAKSSSADYDVTWIAQSGGGGGEGLTDAVKTALLQLAEKVAYIDAHGQDYYDDLYNALYGGTPVPTRYTVTNNLTHVTNSNASTSVTSGSAYTATLAATSGYNINSVQITMGGVDVTGTSYSGGTITIANVTGNIVITAIATERQATLSSISCVFTQGSAVIYDTDSLDTLKQYLVVTAHWSDNTTSTVASSDYTLSGTLTAGTSTITVSYGGKSTTFTVTVTHEANPRLYNWDLTQSLTDTIGGVTAVLSHRGSQSDPTRDANGLSFTEFGQCCDFGAIYGTDRTIEIDFTTFSLASGISYHRRAFMFGTSDEGGNGIMVRNTGVWTVYSGSWWSGSYSVPSDQVLTYFANKTVKIYIDSNGYAKLKVGSDSLGTSGVAFTGTGLHFYLGNNNTNTAGANFYTATATAVRVYGGET